LHLFDEGADGGVSSMSGVAQASYRAGARVAERAGLSLKYVGEIERGEANASIAAIEALAMTVGWDTRRIFPRPRATPTARVIHRVATLQDQHATDISDFVLRELGDPVRDSLSPEDADEPTAPLGVPQEAAERGRRSRPQLAAED
jgi:transcriptional regulator with XRE-family HTH domain